VANRLGKTDNATANTLRDNAIIDAYRQVCQDYKFSWLLKKNTAFAITSGSGNMPSDYNPSFGVLYLAQVVTGTANDNVYRRLSIDQWDLYTTADFLYDIVYDATNSVYVCQTNQTASSTLTLWYYFTPTDLANGTDLCLVPDADVVRDLAVSLWWLAAERDETNADRFYTRYQERLNKLISLDKTSNTMRRPLKSMLSFDDYGDSILATQR
jgi:hypothetical protein